MKKSLVAFFIVFFSLTTGVASAALILSGGEVQPDGSIIVKPSFSGGASDNDGGDLYFKTLHLGLDSNVNNAAILRQNDVAYSTTGEHSGDLFKSLTDQISVGDTHMVLLPAGGLIRLWYNTITPTGGTGCAVAFCGGDVTANFSLVDGDIFAKLIVFGQEVWRVQISEQSFNAVSIANTGALLLVGLMALATTRRFRFVRSDYGGVH